MELRILILTLSNLLATMFSHHHRGLLCKGKRFDCIVVLLCIFFCVSACGICSTNLRPNAPEYGACESSLKSCNSGFSDAVVGGDGLGSVFPPIRNSFQNVCPDTHSFRAPSSLKAATFGGSGNQCNGPFCVGLAQASEVTRNMKGLLLFPHNVIHVGVIYCNNPRNDLRNMSPEVSNLQENCKLVILTNDTTSPQVEIPCEDVPNICFEHQRLSFVGSKDNSKPGDSRSMTAEYAVRNKGLAPNVKVTETADVDALVFGNRVSLLEDVEVVFPMVQVGSYVSKWITVRNPSHLPVTVQLILNKEEIVDECRGPDDMIQNFSAANLVIDEVISAAKYGFSVTESAVTEAYVHPYDYATLGPIIFYPSKRCRWNGSAVIRNNLTGIEMVPLRGIGGLHSLALLERSEHVQSINFDLQMHNLLSFSLLYSLLHMKDMISVCSQPFVKEIYAKNTGDLPLEVKTMRVSGKECGLDGFKIQDCKGFSLDPGESIKLLISYQTDFSAATVQRDLELALASGIFLIPMKASVPFDVLCNCKKFLFWTRVKKLLLGFILFASLFFMVSLDYLCKNDSNSMHITLQHSGKTPIVLPCNQRKDKLSMSGKMTNTICSAGKGATSPIRATCVSYSYDPSETSDQYSENYKQFSLLLNTPKKEKSPTIEVQSSDVTIPPQQGETKTKTGKEKGRRKKKNNKSFGAKLPAVSEVSSSRSGNSTPLSPVAPVSKKSSWPLSPNVEQHHKKFQPSASKTNTSKKHRVLVNSVSETVSSPKVSHSPLSSDASTPLKMFCPASPPMSGIPSRSLVSTSSISFSLRAPGSKLDKQKTVLAPKEVGFEEYTYDIWGGHFSGLHLLLPKDVPCMKSSPDEKNFSSFFVGEPQSIK